MSNDFLDEAIFEHKPSHVFALFSGGDDSVCAAHLAAQHPRFNAVVLIDTGIAIEETHQHVRQTCKDRGWPLLVYKTPTNYDANVREHGFPNPSQHKWMFLLLKRRAVDALIRDYKVGRKDRIVLVTGQRKQESKRRMRTVTAPYRRQGAAVWVAPMWLWSRDERDAYQVNHSLPKNPVKANGLHVSGDCLCGAYADKGDLALLTMFYPAEAKRLIDLQAEVADRFPWAWDETAPKWFTQYKSGQAFLGDEFMPMCWNCVGDNGAGGRAVSEKGATHA